jgi:hypothetical protein
MPHTVAAKVREWARDALTGQEIQSANVKIEYLARRLFDQYAPTSGPYPTFNVRLRDWLGSAPLEQDQQAMFRLVPKLFFVGQEEFTALYRAAFLGPLQRWLIDACGVDLTKTDLSDILTGLVKRTWFCPITDSMNIAHFHHVNRIEGADCRPDWHSLARLGATSKKISQYMDDKGYDRLVLLEDFVGSGSQIEGAVELALRLPDNIRLLIIPLIVCPRGLDFGRKLERRINLPGTVERVRFEPILTLPSEAFVGPHPCRGEDSFWAEVRRLAEGSYTLVTEGRFPANPHAGAPYGPYGYKETGGLIVMYSNCPNNTLPLIHHTSGNWSPLFPRSSRV